MQFGFDRLVDYCANVFLVCLFIFLVSILIQILSTASGHVLYVLAFIFQPSAYQDQYWPVPLFVTTNTFAGVLVNSYLIQRFYNLSKSFWISAILCLCVVMVCGLHHGRIALMVFSDYSSRKKAKPAAHIWTISAAAADILIAAALVCKLRTMKTAFKGTKSLIQHLTITAIQTGSATSIVSIVTLISYIAREKSNVPTACYYLIGPLYVMTLLYNFNLRQHGAPSGSNGRSNSAGNSGLFMNGIHVHRTAMVTVDCTDPQTPDAMEHTSAHDDSSLKQDPKTENHGAKKVRVPDF
ncbi:hypothetical protein C8R44DRAFT_884947 [Mycena epipterygia]|nr:hypothetical protein C8R44DRAFT_884947 [Mycena epipterygia]